MGTKAIKQRLSLMNQRWLINITKNFAVLQNQQFLDSEICREMCRDSLFLCVLLIELYT